MKLKEHKEALLCCKLIRTSGSKCEVTVEMEGTCNGLANAYEAITTQLLDRFVEYIGEDDTLEAFPLILEKALAKSTAGEALKRRMKNG